MATPQTTKKRRYRNISGPVIRRLRNERGWSQAELAAKVQLVGLDLDRADIGKIESQLRSLFDYELFILARTLNVEVGDLNPGLKVTKSKLAELRKGFL